MRNASAFVLVENTGGILKESLTLEYRYQLARYIEEQWPDKLFDAADEGLEKFAENVIRRLQQLRAVRNILLEIAEEGVCQSIRDIEAEFSTPAGRLRRLSGIVDGRKPMKLIQAAEEGNEAFLRNILDRYVRLGLLKQVLLDKGGDKMKKFISSIEPYDPNEETKRLKEQLSDEEEGPEAEACDLTYSGTPSERFERKALGLDRYPTDGEEEILAFAGDEAGGAILHRLEAEMDRRTASGRHQRPSSPKRG